MVKPFENISKNHRKKLQKNLEGVTKNFAVNENILQSFKNTNVIGIILKGTVTVVRNDYNGNTFIVEKLNTNDIFSSSLSILSNDDKMISVTDSSIAFIDYDMLIHNKKLKSQEYFNQFILNIFEITMHIAKEKNKRIEIITKKSIKEKLLEYFRLNYPNSRVVNLDLSITDLSVYLGVNRSALSRELGNLKDEGIIDIKNKKIILLYKK